MGKIAVVAKLTAKEGRGDELIKVLSTMFEPVQDEAGTELYIMNRSSQDPDTVYFYELYSDAEAAAAHSSSDAIKAMFTDLAGILGGRAEITLLEPIGGKGITV